MYAFPQNIRYATSSQQGGRKYMEDVIHVKFKYDDNSDGLDENSHLDYAYIAVFDGHGGAEAAKFAKKHLHDEIVKIKGFWSNDDEQVLKAIREGFLNTHKLMWKALATWPRTVSGFASTAGTTASIVFIKKERLYCAHVGDSGVVLGVQECNEKDHLVAHCVTVDHKPEDPVEKRRIEGSGGAVVAKAGVQRVVWRRPSPIHKGPIRRSTPTQDIPFLAVARSLGDLWSYNWQQDQFVVSPDPDMAVYKLEPNRHRLIILASDGLWNMLRPHEAVQYAYQVEKENTDPSKYRNSAATLVNLALDRWSSRRMRADNTSVVVVTLEEDGTQSPYDDRSSVSSASTVPVSELEPDTDPPLGTILEVSSLITPSHPKYSVPNCGNQPHIKVEPLLKKTPKRPTFRGVRPAIPQSAPSKLRSLLSPQYQPSTSCPGLMKSVSSPGLLKAAILGNTDQGERKGSPASNILRPSDGNDIEFTDTNNEDDIPRMSLPSPFSPIHTPPSNVTPLSHKRHTPSPSLKRPASAPAMCGATREKLQRLRGENSRQVAFNITNNQSASPCTRSMTCDSPQPRGSQSDTTSPLNVDVSSLQSSPLELVSPIWPAELGPTSLEGSSVLITPSPTKPDISAALKQIQQPQNGKKHILKSLAKNNPSAFCKPSGAQNRSPGLQKHNLRQPRYCIKRMKACSQKMRLRASVHRTRSQVKSAAAKSS